MTALLDIFTYPFFQKALVGGILIGLMSPLVGAFLVYRRLSMIGDTLSHVSIAGVALGFLVGLSPQGIGVIFAVIAAFAIEQLRTMYRAYAELSIAIMMSGGVALASIFITMGKGTMNVTGYLFGSIYTLDMADLLLVGGVTLIVLLFALVTWLVEAFEVSPALAALIVGVVVALVAYGLVRVGLSRLKARNLAPRRTVEQLSRDAAVAKESFR